MDVVYYTNKGGREINEDSLFMTDGAYVVCDGLGGHASGEVASNCAVKVLSELCANDPPYSIDLINTFYMRANQAVVNLKEKALTTIVGGFVKDGIFYYQSVGDSRLYYFRDNKVFAQTKDDSVCQAAVDLGTMRYEDIRTSEDRSRLLKVLGNDMNLAIKRRYDPIPMQKGDAFIVCSDGFWEHVLEREMEETLDQSQDAEEWLNRMLQFQYNRAKNRDDNYTVICAIVGEKDACPDHVVPLSEAEKAERVEVIESALHSLPESKAEKLHDEVHTEQFETMPVREVSVEPGQKEEPPVHQSAPQDNAPQAPVGASYARQSAPATPAGASHAQQTTPPTPVGTGDAPYNVPYSGSFRRYGEGEETTQSYDDGFIPRQDDAGYNGYDGYGEEYEEKKGFFARLFGRK